MLGGKNKQQHRPLGYTIVEVMIVLAVSGIMFLIAANFINGKQERTAFNEGSNDMTSQLQNVVEDITDGHYSDVPIYCTSATDGSSVSFPPLSSQGQGTNSGCVFWGKLIHFFGSPGGQANQYNVFSLAAARTTNPSPGEQAIPNVNGNDLTTQSSLPQSLYVQAMHVTPTSGGDQTGVYNIGFVQGLGAVADLTTGVYQSGAQTIGLIYADSLDSSHPGTESSINNTTIHQAQSARICLTDGTRYAVIFVGGTSAGASSNNNNQLSISAQQFSTAYPGHTLC